MLRTDSCATRGIVYESEMKNRPDDDGNDDEEKEDDDDDDDSGGKLPAMTRKRRRGLSRYAPRL